MIEVMLTLVIAVSSFFRLFNLGTLPISLFGDEVDVGYHAWSLITTGRDYMGHFLPTYIQSLTEWRAPLLMYLTAPFVGLFGNSPFIIRLPVALLSIASIYLLYLLVKELFGNKIVALLAAFVLSITPWHIHYSRASFEVVPLLFLEMLGTYLFIRKKEFLALIFFALTLYTYSTATVFTPLIVTVLFLIYRPAIFKKQYLWKYLPSIIIIIPIVYSIFFGQAAGRFKGISIFNDRKIIDSLIIQRTDPWVNKSSIEILFHNKYFAYVTAFGENYLKAFSPEFLFLQGDPNFRQSISGQGELLWISLPFFLYGLFIVLRNIREKSSRLIICWLLIAPIASSLTQGGGNHATRLFLMITPLVIISARGLGEFTFQNKNKIILGIIFLIFIFCFANYWHRYSSHYRFESAEVWQSGYREVFSQLQPLLKDSHNIYINYTESPSLIKFALFSNYPPKQFQRDFRGSDPESFSNELFQGFRFGDKYYFGQIKNLELFKKLLLPGDIYLAVQGKEIPGDWDWSKTPPTGLEALYVFRNPLGKPHFYLISKTR